MKYKVTYVPVEPFTAKNQLFKTPITCPRVVLELLPKRQLDQIKTKKQGQGSNCPIQSMSLRRSLHRAAQLLHGCDGCKSRLFTRAKSWLETSHFFRYETFEPNLSAVKEKAILLLHCIKMSLKIWKRKEEIELLWLLLSHFISFCAISSNEPHFHGKKNNFWVF